MLTFTSLEEMLSYRTRNIFVETYATEEEIVATLTQHQKSIRAYAYIWHDKDVRSDGTPKEPHWHVLIILHNSSCCNAVIKWFKKYASCNTFAEPVKTTVPEAYDYLTHKNDKNKSPYDDTNIVHGNLEYWMKISDDADDDDNVARQIIDDIMQGTPYYDMVIRYGREWVIYHERYELMACKIRDGYRL